MTSPSNMPPGGCRPLARLPTLQRNALRKLFDRAEFTPEEVARLGYRRIQQAEGIGLKGMATIQSWLSDYGYELQPEPATLPVGGKRSPDRRKRLESALRVLRNYGYVVYGPEEGPQTTSRPISK